MSGIIIFDYAHLNDTYLGTLTESIFKPVKKEVVITQSPQVQQSQKEKKRGGRK